MLRSTPIFITVLTLAICTATQGSTIHVPADQPTIQAGINAAANGDTVLVAPGTYTEAITFGGKWITLTSVQGSRVTTIDAQGLDSCVILIPTHPNEVIIDGFTITGGVGFDAGNGIRQGGGVNIQGGSVSIRECHIVDNTAIGTSANPSNTTGRGGGIHAGGAVLSIRNCLIANNKTEGACGGGRGGGCYITFSTTDIIGCTIQNNEALGGTCTGTGMAQGGGLYLTSGSATILNSIFKENSLSAASSSGGGIHIDLTGNATMTNCAVVKNHAFQCCSTPGPISSGIMSAGGLFMHGCTIAHNTLGGVGGPGNPAGGIRGSTTAVNITSCIVFGNDAAEIFGNNIAVGNSCVEGGFAGNGNFNSDPLFINPPSGDYQLGDKSPCRDIGDLSSLTLDPFDLDEDGETSEYIPFDLHSSRRLVNGYLDVGAYEWQRTCEADISPSSPSIAGNGTIDVDDLLTVINGWGECDGCVADVNSDNSVDVDDLLVVINGWGNCK